MLSEVGTHVFDLYIVTHWDIPVEEFIKKRLSDAYNRLQGTIDLAERHSPPIPIQKIIRLLLDEPDGAGFVQIKEKTGGWGEHLFSVINPYQALVFNPKTQSFYFSSGSMKTVAKQKYSN